MCVGCWERESGGLVTFQPTLWVNLKCHPWLRTAVLRAAAGYAACRVSFWMSKGMKVSSLSNLQGWFFSKPESDRNLETFWWTFLSSVGFPCGSAGKESSCNTGDLGLIPGLGRSPGEGKDYPLQYSGLEKSMDYIYIVHGVVKSRIRLSDFHFTLLFSKPCGRRWPTGRWVAMLSS